MKRLDDGPRAGAREVDSTQDAGHLVTAAPSPVSLPDPSDDMFLEVALAGRAECLVTGNARHFPARKRQGMTVLRPSGFVARYREQP